MLQGQRSVVQLGQMLCKEIMGFYIGLEKAEVKRAEESGHPIPSEEEKWL